MVFKFGNDDIELKNENDADNVLNSISDNYEVEIIDKKDKKKNSKYPFITSTLQQ